MADTIPGFLDLPFEVRILIYKYFFDYSFSEKVKINHKSQDIYPRRRSLLYYSQPEHRSEYMVPFPFNESPYRLTTYETTFITIKSSRSRYDPLLRVNRQIYEEAVPILSGSILFEFGKIDSEFGKIASNTSLEAVIPFFSDLSPQTRFSIQEISLIKACGDWDNDMIWRICNYMKRNLNPKESDALG